MTNKTTYRFYSTDGAFHKGFSREELLLWYYDGKLKEDAPIQKVSPEGTNSISIDSLEPDGEKRLNTSGLRDASVQGPMKPFNLGAMMLAPVWTLVYKQGSMCAALWACVLVIGFVAWASTENITTNLHFLFRLDAVSHLIYWGISLYIGIVGSRGAWRARRFRDYPSFGRCMLLWQLAGAVVLLLVIAGFAYFVPLELAQNAPTAAK